MQHTSDELHAWFKNVQPLYVELFNAAYVMCGNFDIAEYALRAAIMEVWLQDSSGGGMGFRERLRGALRREAFDAALSDEGLAAEFTWPGLTGDQGDDVIASQLLQERVEQQRLVLLRYGCGLSLRAVAQLTGLAQSYIRAELRRFEARCRRKLSGQERSRAEALIVRRARRLLSQRGPNLPPPAQVYRAFEAEAAGAQMSGHRVSRIVGGVFLVLTALLCAGAFWLFAVLVQPV